MIWFLLASMVTASGEPCGAATFPRIESAEQLGWLHEHCLPEVLYVRLVLGDVLTAPDATPDLSLLRAAQEHIAALPGADRPLLALRLTITEPDTRAPKWMRREGLVRKSKGHWAPVWSEPRFLELHTRVLEAIGDTLGSSEAPVGFVEIGSYGMWGEWHHTPDSEPLRALEADIPTRLALLDQYEQALGDYPLIIAYDALIGAQDDDDDTGCDEEARPIAEALAAMQVGLRNDAIHTQRAQFSEEVGEAAACLGRHPHAAFPGIWGGEFQSDEQAEQVLASDDETDRVLQHVLDEGLLFVGPGGFEPLAQEQEWRSRPTVQALRGVLDPAALRRASQGACGEGAWPDTWQDLEIEAKWAMDDATYDQLLADLPDGARFGGYTVNVRWGGVSRKFVDVYYDVEGGLAADSHTLRHRERLRSDPTAASNQLADLDAAQWSPDWDRIQYKTDPVRAHAVWFRDERGDCKVWDRSDEDLCPAPREVQTVLTGGSPEHPAIERLRGDHPTLDLSAMAPTSTVEDYRYRIELERDGEPILEISADRLRTRTSDDDTVESTVELELEIVLDGYGSRELHELFRVADQLERRYALRPSTHSKGGNPVPDRCAAMIEATTRYRHEPPPGSDPPEVR